MQNPVTIDQYLYYLYSPKPLSGLYTVAYTNTLYKKQFNFQEGHSTDHTILQLVDQIHNNFKQNNFTLGVFINLSKELDTVDHNILFKKFEIMELLVRTLNGSKFT